MNVPFNRPPVVGTEMEAVRSAVASGKLCGDGEYTKLVCRWFESRTGCPKTLLTTSCTHALEMSALLLDLEPGDEVIMPSYTFVSTANAFALRGARIVFVDIQPGTLNIDPATVEAAAGPRTRAVVAVHYAGVACDMDALGRIAEARGLVLVEDAAQGVGSRWRGRPLGTFGATASYSFHETKNVTCGEGGLLLINDPALADRAEVIREKGTDRSRFFRGLVDKYTWRDIGSSYLPSELNAAFLYAQLEAFEKIQGNRMETWNVYSEAFADLARSGRIEIASIPDGAEHNAHMFWMKLRDMDDRSRFIAALKERGIGAVFHYIPLHSSPAGSRLGRFDGEDRWTTRESERLVRLPLWYGMGEAERGAVIEAARDYLA